MEEGPRSGSGAGVLAGHKQSDHDVRDFSVRKGASVLVGLTHERLDHVVSVLNNAIVSD